MGMFQRLLLFAGVYFMVALFILYLNDLPASLFNTLTSLNMSNYELQTYADDIKTYTNISSTYDAARF